MGGARGEAVGGRSIDFVRAITENIMTATGGWNLMQIEHESDLSLHAVGYVFIKVTSAGCSVYVEET